MSNARKEGKPKRNKRNLNKRLTIIQKNVEIIAKLKKEL
jgi:hypothetical protein